VTNSNRWRDGGTGGRRDGGTDGERDGRTDGRRDGRTEGRTDGGTEGLRDGWTEGGRDGRTVGRRDGPKDGGRKRERERERERERVERNGRRPVRVVSSAGRRRPRPQWGGRRCGLSCHSPQLWSQAAPRIGRTEGKGVRLESESREASES
jgi:hypothetical protein